LQICAKSDLAHPSAPKNQLVLLIQAILAKWETAKSTALRPVAAPNLPLSVSTGRRRTSGFTLALIDASTPISLSTASEKSSINSHEFQQIHPIFCQFNSKQSNCKTVGRLHPALREAEL
jgi:hypothetical protein